MFYSEICLISKGSGSAFFLNATKMELNASKFYFLAINFQKTCLKTEWYNPE